MALNTPSPRQHNPTTSSLQSISKAPAELDTELESERAEVSQLKVQQANLQTQVELLRSERASLTQEIKDLVEKKLLLQEDINLHLLGQVSAMSTTSSEDTLPSRRASSKSSDYKNLFRATLTARGFYSSQSSDSSAISESRPVTVRQSLASTGDQSVAEDEVIAKIETVEIGTFGPIMNVGDNVDAGEPALRARVPIMEAAPHVKSEIISLLSDGEEDQVKENKRNREGKLQQDHNQIISNANGDAAEVLLDAPGVSNDLLPDSEDDDIISRKPKRKYRKSDCVDTPVEPPVWGFSITQSSPSRTGHDDVWAAWRSSLLSSTPTQATQHRSKRRATRSATRPM